MKNIVIFGSGGHAKVILAEILQFKSKYKFHGFVDESKKIGSYIVKIKNKSYRTVDIKLKKIKNLHGIIGVGDNFMRFKYYENIKKKFKTMKWETIISKNSIIKPKSVYGKTKIKCEKIIQSFCKNSNINYGILRYFNIAGSSPSGKIGLINKSDHLFKNFSREIMKKKPVLKIYGNNYKTKDGSCIRDFVHVSDIAEIHLKVLNKIDKINKSVVLNCGYNKGTSVLEVAKEFKKQTSKKVKILITKRRKADLVKIIATNKKLMRFIQWKPKFNDLRKIVKSCLMWEKRQ